MEDVFIPLIVVRDPVHRPAVADLSLHHQVEDRGDADRVRREVARRAARCRAPPRRPAVHDRADHDRRESRLAAAVPARNRSPAPADRRGVSTMTRNRQAAPASIATSATARSWASAPASPTTPGSTSRWSGSCWSPPIVHERRRAPPALFHRRLDRRRQAARARRSTTTRSSASGRACAPRRPAPRATSAAGCATSTAAWPTSKAM